jgi:hypothetical protein
MYSPKYSTKDIPVKHGLFFQYFFFFRDHLKGFNLSLDVDDFVDSSEHLYYQDKDDFYKNKHIVLRSPCFEQFFLHKILNNGKPLSHVLRDEEITDILQDYQTVISFPPNIQAQFLAECERILQSFLGMNKDKIVCILIKHAFFWDECRVNAMYVSLVLDWIRENKNPEFEKWLVKMLKIFILGMLPDIEKRKKGKEFEDLVVSHFYDIYNFR